MKFTQSRRAPFSSGTARRPVQVFAAKGFGATPAPAKQPATVKPATDSKPSVPKKACPCGSGIKYQNCCEPYHRGSAPPTPDATLKARFSGYVLGQEPFLMKTFHPDYHTFQYGTAPGEAKEKLQKDVTTSCTRFTYSALDIKKVDKPNDTEAFIEFTYRKHEKNLVDRAADYEPKNKPQAFVPKWLRTQQAQQKPTSPTTSSTGAPSAAASIAPDASTSAVDPSVPSANSAAAAPAPSNQAGTLMAECSKFVLHEGMWKFSEFTVLEVDDGMIQSVLDKAKGGVTSTAA